MKLNLERLNLEYIQWTTSNGTGRDDNDLRFGQYISNKYELPSKVEVFYIENANKAYDTVMTWLREEQIENIL